MTEDPTEASSSEEKNRQQSDSSSNTSYQAHYDWANETVTGAVVSAVSAVEGIDPLDVEPLYSKVDPDALDKLFSPMTDGVPRHNVALSFLLHGYSVTVYSEGRVDVQEIDDQSME